MFAHRLGLIPINLDPRKLDWRDGTPMPPIPPPRHARMHVRANVCVQCAACRLLLTLSETLELLQFDLIVAVQSSDVVIDVPLVISAANSPATERNTVVLKLHVDCTRKADGSINHEKGSLPCFFSLSSQRHLHLARLLMSHW